MTLKQGTREEQIKAGIESYFKGKVYESVF